LLFISIEFSLLKNCKERGTNNLVILGQPFVPSYGPYFSLNSPTIRRKIVLSDEKMVDLK